MWGGGIKPLADRVSVHYKKSAFTLAEVLITLGIIGVVATLTLPNVMSGYAKKSQVAQLQRTVNALSGAIQNYLLENKADTLDETNFNNDAQNFFEKYLGATYLGTDYEDAFPKNYQDYKTGEVFSISGLTKDKTIGCGKLATGAAVCIDRRTSDGKIRELRVLMDVNADAAPNKTGRDIFVLGVSSTGRIAPYSNWKTSPENANNYCLAGSDTGGETAAYCFQKIMLDGWEMNY